MHRISNNSYLWYYLYKTIYPSWSRNINYSYKKQQLLDWKHFMLKLFKQKSYTASHFRLYPYLDSKYSKIEEPLVSDIDPVTNTGVIAISKLNNNQQHSIAFFSYPSYALIRELTLHLSAYSHWSCQIVGIQTLQVDQQTIRVFAVAIGQPAWLNGEEEDEEEEECMNVWKFLLIYRLFDNGDIACLANINMMDQHGFLGREVSFFGLEDWVEPWLQIVSPDNVTTDPHIAYLLACGPSLPRYFGLGQIIQFDTRGSDNTIIDPSKTHLTWDENAREFKPEEQQQQQPNKLSTFTSKLISTIRLGAEVSCMVHFRHLPQLNHLICTGNFDTNELSIYDWRFGVKVGVLTGSRDDNVQPWGFETTWAIPLNKKIDNLRVCGPRLIVVGDFEEKFEIKVWDISKLLQVEWQPFNNDITNFKQHVYDDDMPFRYKWWERGTQQLKYTCQQQNDRFKLPYTIDQQAILRVHVLDAQVKFTAYNILQTSLYLLNEEGKLIVMDIETGEIMSTVETGVSVDVNVLGDKQIIITKRYGLLRSTLP